MNAISEGEHRGARARNIGSDPVGYPGFQSQLRRTCDGNGPFKRHIDIERIPGTEGAICCRRGDARYACTVINIDRLGAGCIGDETKGKFSERRSYRKNVISLTVNVLDIGRVLVCGSIVQFCLWR